MHDELGLHLGKENLVLGTLCIEDNRTVVVRADMPQALLNDILHVFDGPADADPALQPGHGEDVFILMKVKEESEKFWLKAQHSEN